MIITNENKGNFQSESENIFNELRVILQPRLLLLPRQRSWSPTFNILFHCCCSMVCISLSLCVKGTLRGGFFQSTSQQATFPCRISAVHWRGSSRFRTMCAKDRLLSRASRAFARAPRWGRSGRSGSAENDNAVLKCQGECIPSGLLNQGVFLDTSSSCITVP